MNKLTELREIMIEHQKADQLVQGSWWDSTEQTGCFYGCAVHSDEDAIEKAIDNFGIEPWVAHWSEKVFERLPKGLALSWPVELLDAMIAFKGDYKDVYHKLSIKRLQSLLPTEDQKVNSAINKVIKYHKAPSEEKRQSARSAAWSAADSADSAADSAEAAAHSAEAAAHAAEAAAHAARSAAYSAAHAARSAADSADSARSEHWKNERKWMLELLGGE